jgi:chromosomal replication initiation ATPase DnaA
MEKSEYYGKVIKVMTELTEFTEKDILGKSRRAEVVDARWVLICLLKESGWSTHRIAEAIGHPERTINHVLSNMDDRIKYTYNGIGNILAIARKQLQK